MSNTENQNDQAVVFDLADEPVIVHAVFPELPKPRVMQRLSNAAGIVQPGYSFVKKFQDALGVLRIELAEFPAGYLGQFNVTRP